MHGRMFLEWFSITYPNAVKIIKEKNLQLGSGETPSSSSNWIKKEEEDDMTEAAPVTRNRMSEYMRVRLECDELRMR